MRGSVPYVSQVGRALAVCVCRVCGAVCTRCEVCACAVCVREWMLECEVREVKSPRLALGLNRPTGFSPAGPGPSGSRPTAPTHPAGKR